ESLQRIDTALARAYPYGLFNGHDEDLAVTDLAGERRFDDGVDGRIDHGGRQHHFHAYFGQEVDDVLGPAIQLGVPFLPAKALDLGDGQAIDADIGQGFAHFVQLERLDDCRD